MPKEVCETPLDEKEIALRPKQFKEGSAMMHLFSEGLGVSRSFPINVARDGRVQEVTVDAQVVKAMGGGLSRMYDDMQCSGMGEQAQKIIVDLNAKRR